MKQQILNLKKKLLLVELSEDDKKNITNFVWDGYSIKTKHLIGKLTGITEQQFAQLALIGWSISFKTAKEFFFSYLESQGIYFENKLRDPELTMRQGDGSVYYGASEEDFKEFEEAEQKVWNKDLIYVFEII
jgi:hypothetical protein